MTGGHGRERRHRGPGAGPGGPGPFPFGMGGFPGPGFGPGFGRGRGRGRRGPKVSRGDVRAAILVLLDEQPRHGYELIQEINNRSGGVWRPSPGSVYPALQQLEDEGLVRMEQTEGRRVMHLTDAGKEYVETHRDELAAPWDAVSDSVGDELINFRDVIAQLGIAAMQVAAAGSDAQIAEAQKLLADTRRSLYRILAEDTDEAAEPTGDDSES